jgi:hypothetical protein
MKIYYIISCIIFSLNISCKTNFKVGNTQETLLAIHRGEYRIGLYKNESDKFDPKKVTHVIVIGSALKEDSEQFFQSGISRAQRYKDLWPKHQIVIMSSPDVKGKTDEQVFNKYNIKVVKLVFNKFYPKFLLNEISEFEKISSLDFYGHSSPWAIILSPNNAAFDPSAHYEELKLLRTKFLRDAYVTINGCNSGFYLAPDLSRALRLPVSGSLTSSMFERFESDNFWYKEQDWNSSGYVLTNRFSYKDEGQCSLGLCTRMKSAKENYSSFWGTFTEGGLSFDKFFCNYENNNDGSCERGMAKSLLSFPSVYPISLNSKISVFKLVLYDWLCSTDKDKTYFQKCVEGIENAIFRGDLEYQSHPTNELKCDFNSCHAIINCKYKPLGGPVPGSCNITAASNPYPQNIATEFLSFIKGFKALHNH